MKNLLFLIGTLCLLCGHIFAQSPQKQPASSHRELLASISSNEMPDLLRTKAPAPQTPIEGEDADMLLTDIDLNSYGLSGKARQWRTANSLKMHSYTQPIAVCEGRGAFSGTITLSENGAWATGTVIFGEISITGDSMELQKTGVKATETRFVITDKKNPALIHFAVDSVTVIHDLEKHTTQFSRNKTLLNTLNAEFPQHKYHTSLTNGEYLLDEGKLNLQSISAYAQQNYFVSVAEQDSLNFMAASATFLLATQRTEITGVPYIDVADARISPNSQRLAILANGQIDSLRNAIVTIGQENTKTHLRRHRIYDATVGIASAKRYGCRGKYNYLPVNNREQYIEFTNINVQGDTTTVASGKVGHDREFYLTDRILFRGNATMNASQKHLVFAGEVKVVLENPTIKNIWFAFEKSVVNPDSIFMPIKEGLTDDKGQKLMVGLNFNNKTKNFYSSFLEPLHNDDDTPILSSKGGFTIDRKTKDFRIGSQDALRTKVYKGAIVSFNNSNNIITSHGRIAFPDGFLPKTGSLTMAGDWSEDKRNNTINTNLTIACNFGKLPQDPIKNTVAYFLSVGANNPFYDFNHPKAIMALSEMLDPTTPEETNTYVFLEQLKNALTLTDFKLAQMLPATVLMGDVNFQYDRNLQALYCKEPVALLGLQGLGVYQYFNSKILYEFMPKKDTLGNTFSYHRMTIYLAIDDFNYIYFCLDGNALRTRSSYIDAYNYPLQNELSKKKQKPEQFRTEVAEEDEVNKFRKNFDKTYGAAKRKASVPPLR